MFTLFYLAILFLLLGMFFSTLYAAYHLAGEAGIPRLKEKYPKASKQLMFWEPHWNILRSSLRLSSILIKVLGIVFGILFLTRTLHHPTLIYSFILSLIGIYFLVLIWHVLPHTLSESYADRLTITFLPVTSLFSILLWIFVWPVACVEKGLLTLFLTDADEENRPSPEDEIRSLVDQANEKELEEDERELIRSVFEFGETVTREIMTPRIDAESLEDTLTIEECVSEIKKSSHSRFPIFHETMDHIQGMVHVKDLLRLLSEGKGDGPVIQAVNESTFVPESMPINDLLNLMRTEQIQLAIVVDEYGGTAGLVTIEDIIEELVGEIQDEYDHEEEHIHRLSGGSVILDARTPVDKANKLLDLTIPEKEEYDSIGGYVFHVMGKIPRPGEVLDNDAYTITIQTANSHRLHTVRILKNREVD